MTKPLLAILLLATTALITSATAAYLSIAEQVAVMRVNVTTGEASAYGRSVLGNFRFIILTDDEDDYEVGMFGED